MVKSRSLDDRQIERDLSTVPLFRGLAPPVLAALQARADLRAYPPGAAIAPEHAQAARLCIVQRGTVMVSRVLATGQKVVLDVLRDGSAFGQRPAPGGRDPRVAEALTACVLWTIPWCDVEQLMLEHSDLAVRIAYALAERVQRAEERIERYVTEDVPTRIAALLISLADSPGQRFPPVVRGYTHHDLALMAGTTRESATSALNNLQNRGIVSLRRRRITLLDPDRLSQLAANAHDR